MCKNQSVFKSVLYSCLCLIFMVACSKDEVSSEEGGGKSVSGEDAESIRDYIANLSYNPDEMLNVQTSTGTESYEVNDNPVVDRGTVEACRTNYYDIRSNFENVVMFDPGNGVIYPGALVIGNQAMLGGAPQPLQVGRAEASYRVDLPGIGANGNITVANPGRNTDVQAGIDEALEYWNENVQPQGYEIDADAYFEKTVAYSSQQMSLDLGVGVDWAGGSSFESNFNYSKTTEKRVAAMLYRQVFYEVTMDTPSSPSAVFGSNVDLATIESAINNATPPAYVHSVQYGRVIMIRMETTDTTTEVNLEAVLDYATATRTVDATINAQFESVIKQSTFNVVTIGGNAQVATNVITGASVDEGEGGLNYVISENSLYSRDNPGAPIGYTIKYLKDNRVAKMGYNTDYSIETCGEYPYDHKSIYAKRTTGYKIRYRFSYFEEKQDTQKYSNWKELDDKNVNYSLSPKDGAHDVKVQFEFWDLGWKTMGEFNLGYVNKDYYFEGYCSKTLFGICTEVSVKQL